MQTVTLRTPLKTRLGNVIAPAGTYELLEPIETHPDGSRTGTIFSKDHYAARNGVRVGFRLRKTDIVKGA